MEDRQMDPSGGLSHFPSRDKGFRGFKKGRSSLVFSKVQFWLLINILNWKDCQVDPIGFAPLFPSGDKHFAYYITNERNDGVYY